MNCEKCVEDRGWCVYCQRSFPSPGSLHRHIHSEHADSIRAQVCPAEIP